MFRYIFALIILLPFFIIIYPFIMITVPFKDKFSIGFRYKLSRFLIKVANFGLIIRFDVKNKQYLNLEGATLFYGNHQSDYDFLTFIILSKLPINALAKIQVRKYVVIGKISRYLNCTYLDRDNLRSSVKTINECIKKAEMGERQFIFPEGTRTRDENQQIGQFKPGAFQIAIKSGAPIVPFVIEGTYNAFKISKLFRVKIYVRLLTPIYQEEYKDLDAIGLCALVEGRVREEYALLREGLKR